MDGQAEVGYQQGGLGNMGTLGDSRKSQNGVKGP